MRSHSYKRVLVLVAVLLAAASPAAAQLGLQWTSRSDLNAGLPESIRVYEADAPSLPLRAWYVRADLSDTTWTLRGLLEAGGQPVSDFSKPADALVAINGGYFGAGQSYSFAADGGEVLAHNLGALNRPGGTFYPTRAAFSVLEDGAPDVAWIYDVGGTTYAYPEPAPNEQGAPAPQPSAAFPEGGQPWPAFAGIGGGPMLVQEGQIVITWEEEVFFGSGIGSVTDRQPRTAIGYTADEELLLLVVDGRSPQSRGASLIELADAMADLGAVEAVNLDGGGSSTLVVSDRVINDPSDGSERSVVTAVALAPDLGGGTTGSLFFDTGDACCFRQTGSWISSSNTPYYGDTQALLNGAGSGDDRAVFVFEGIEPGRYEVDAWWVASFNRATNTPYTVYHDGEAYATVRVDQSDAATLNQWNRIGTYELAPGDSVVVTDDASGTEPTSYVCVDAMRLTRVSPSAAAPPEAGTDGEALRVYPNPVRGVMHVVLTSTQAAPAAGQVVDLLGRVVHRFELDGRPRAGRARVTLPDLAPGVYVVRVQTAAGPVQQPVVVVD